MKHLIRLSILSLTVVMITGLSSCHNKETQEPTLSKGKPTNIKLAIKIPKAGATYATNDPNATEDEAKLVTADVFIYEPPMGVLVQHHQLAMADFTQTPGTDVYVTTNLLASTTGPKTVMVGLNLPAATRALLAAGSLTTVRDVQTIAIADASNTTNGFTMFSSVETDATFVADETNAANKITVPVKRLASKITVEKSATIDIDPQGGTLMPTLTFTPRNSNRRIFYLQQLNLQDPNWAIGSWNASEFEQGGEDPGAPPYIAINDAGVADPRLLTPQYIIENTSEQHLEKETSYASIRGEYIPGAVWEYTNTVDATGGFTLNAGHGIAVPQTFYLLFDDLGNRFYFFNIDVANDYNAIELGNFGPLNTFTNGYCYWNMFLNPTGAPTTTVPPFLNPASKYDVLRNSYYKATITRILAPGNPSPQPTRPDQPVQIDTRIEVSVDVLFWALVADDYELKP